MSGKGELAGVAITALALAVGLPTTVRAQETSPRSDQGYADAGVVCFLANFCAFHGVWQKDHAVPHIDAANIPEGFLQKGNFS